MNFLAELFCKKRKSPQCSHSSSPPKQTSRAQTSNSSNDYGNRICKSSQPDQDGNSNQLKESTQTQLISESEEEVPCSENKSSQGSTKMNDKISATTASSKKKKEQDLQTKGEKHEKVTKVKSKAENFMQGEGLQAEVGKRKNNEENGKEKTQEQRENNDSEVRESQELDEDEFSDDLSCQISSNNSGSVADLDGISQVESEYVSARDKRSLESPEKGETRRVPKAKETQKIERTQAEALEELQNFPLSELRLTKEKYFDTRRTLTKKYLVLCEQAGQDARSYYYNEMYKPEKGSGEKLKENGLKKATEEQEESDIEGALRELKKFPLNELKLTKDKLFDQRYKQTKVYLDLCGKAKKNPEQYYKENLK